MSRCQGLHCEGCGKHGGGFVALVVVLAAAAVAVHAAWHAIVGALEIVAYTMASVTAAAVLAVAVYAGVRIRAWVLAQRDRRISPQVRAVITEVRAGRPVPVDGTSARAAIEAPQPPLAWPMAGQWRAVSPRDADGGRS